MAYQREIRTLKQRLVGAAAWTLSGHAAGQAIRFGANLLLTRMLVPDMFGIVAIAIVVLQGLNLLSDLGLRANIIQSARGNDPAFLNTVWIVQIIRSVLLASIAVAIAGLLYLLSRFGFVTHDSVYADPRLPSVICALAIAMIIGASSSTKLDQAVKHLNPKRVVQIEVVTQAAGSAVMLIWAYFSPSIWALVMGAVFGAIARAALSHVWLFGISNRWQWDADAFREIHHFGKWIFLASALAFFAMSSDRLILGALTSSSTLGIYAIAFNMFALVEQVLSSVITGATFPALAEVARVKPEALKQNFYRIHAVLAPVAYLASGLMFTLGQPVINLLYDHRYSDAGWMLETLALGLLMVPTTISIQCSIALGLPKVSAYANLTRFVAMIIGIPAGFRLFGLHGAILAVPIASFAVLPVMLYFNIRSGLLDWKRELLLLPVFGIGVLAGYACKLFLSFLGLQS